MGPRREPVLQALKQERACQDGDTRPRGSSYTGRQGRKQTQWCSPSNGQPLKRFRQASDLFHIFQKRPVE